MEQFHPTFGRPRHFSTNLALITGSSPCAFPLFSVAPRISQRFHRLRRRSHLFTRRQPKGVRLVPSCTSNGCSRESTVILRNTTYYDARLVRRPCLCLAISTPGRNQTTQEMNLPLPTQTLNWPARFFLEIADTEENSIPGNGSQTSHHPIVIN